MAKLLKRIKIEKIGYGGVGLARMSDGKRILIKGGALPGSIVDLKIVKQKKDYVEAHIVNIIQLDQNIVDGEIFCPHFFYGMQKKASNIASSASHSEFHKIGCGGCKWQMLSYQNQLQLKEHIVNDAFTKLKKKLQEFHILPIIPSPQEKHYRNKIEFSFGKYVTKASKQTHDINTIHKIESQSSNNQSQIGSHGSDDVFLSNRSCGFHKQGEFSKIVDIEYCFLISDTANTVYTRIKELCKASGLPVYDQKTHQGFFRHLVIRQGIHTDQFLVNLSVANDNLKTKYNKQRNRLLDTLKTDELLKHHVTTFLITYNNGLADIIKSPDSETKICWGEGYIYETLQFKNNRTTSQSNLLGDNNKEQSGVITVTFRISPFSFFQTNTLGAQQLFTHAMSMVGHVQGTILDLYCGTGSIGISFLKSGKGDKLVGIEVVEDAIIDAWQNAKINGIEHQVIFLAAPAEKAFSQHLEIKKQLDNLGLIIVDPPREGLHPTVIKTICDLKKESDFKLLYISCNPITMVRDIELFLQGGFTIKKIQPIDMFPQTHHIECIGVLT